MTNHPLPITAATTDPSGVMARLKAETQDLHNAAEDHELQRTLFKGRLAREKYVEHLGQLFVVHRALEARLVAAQAATPAIAAVVKDYQLQSPYLRADLAHFGVDPERIAPTPAAAAIVERIERTAKENPVALLGYHYVLEGSNNGSKHVAIAVRKAYGLTAGQGDRYLDPYGERQRELWAEFKRDMEAVGFDDAQAAALVDAARAMFAAISAIGDDLMAQAAV